MKPKLTKIKDIFGPVPRSQIYLSFGIALLLAGLALNTTLYRVEAYFYDLRVRLQPPAAPHADILLLPLGDGPLPEHLAPDSLATQRLALARLLSAHPKQILYLNRFDPAEVEANPAEAEAFVALARRAEREGTRVLLGTDVDLAGPVEPPYPLSLLPSAPAILHKDGTMFSEDKVVRRALLTVFGQPSIHLRAAYPELSEDALRARAGRVKGAYYYAPGEAWHTLIHFPFSTEAETPRFPLLSLSDVLAGKDLARAEGKTVLVEYMRREPLGDFAYTPYSRDTYRNPRLVIHGAILDTLLKDNGVRLVAPPLDVLLTFFLALALAFTAITMRPTRGILALGLSSLALFALSLFLFRFGVALRLVHPLLAMFFTYYLIVPYRAIFEYKKRWEVQEKHDLLVQVEEMKGNFLSLMSHDLKTPVARIQGLAELVLRQGNLSEEQGRELGQILESTESLDKFISKILHLTKVESNEIKLHARPKDVNKLLEQCVQKLSFQAARKEIRVDLDLEPLFPIPVDPALAIQVFTNLIDNAIKYSPAGARVRVSSREVGDHVEIAVEDNGPGLAEAEMAQLFTKFFRGETHPGDESKGSGLGLYLSRYFITLHGGRLRAESRPGSGSRFVVELPVRATPASAERS